MAISRAALFFVLVFAVFEAGFSQQDCQADIVSKLDAITDKLDSLETRMNALHGKLGSMPCLAARSCAEILEDNSCSPSGYYWVANITGHPNNVYCDMTRSCGGVTGGWMRVAYLDMTNSSHQCPSGLMQRTDTLELVRTCAAVSNSATCSSVLHGSRGIQYSSVCGKIRAFRANTLDGFVTFTSARGSTIDSNYVDGVSLTHGSAPRKPIWTFAAAGTCGVPPPDFVGNDYFFDIVQTMVPINLQDPLWDGEGCTSACCQINSPPWFYKQLPQPTTDDIEMRVCRDQSRGDEDLGIQVVEIYIK